jgi:hypothetical protein
MKTTEKTIKKGNLIGLSFFLASSIVNQLQASNSLIDGFKKSVEGDGIISVYIIGGILVFGIVGYFIVTKISKDSEKSNDAKHYVRNRSSRNHHHQHRVIK